MEKQLYKKVLVFSGCCPDCFEEIVDPGANFCTQCKRNLVEFQTICYVCGQGIHTWMFERGKYKYCGRCGTKLEHSMTPYEKLSLSWDEELVPYPV